MTTSRLIRSVAHYPKISVFTAKNHWVIGLIVSALASSPALGTEPAPSEAVATDVVTTGLDRPREHADGNVGRDAIAAMAPVADAAALPWGHAMDDFITSALTADPSMDRARANMDAAQQGVTAAKWQFGPTPSLTVEPSGSGYVQVLRIQQPLYTGGALTAGLRAAQISVTSSRQELAAVRRQLKITLVSTWADWVKSSQRAASLEQLTRQHQDLLAMIQRRASAGTATQSDAALAAARLSAVQAEWTQARLESDMQRQQLQRLAHRPVAPPLLHALDGDAPPAPTLAGMLDSIQLSPDMAIARAGVDLAHQELAKSKASLLPTLSLRIDKQTGVANDRRVGLVLQSGLSGGLGTLAGINAARSRILAAQAAVAATEQDLFSRYQLEFTRYASASATARSAVNTAASSDQVLASYQRQFAAGKRAWLDLLNMVRENHSARQSLHEAAVEERASLYRLRVLMDTRSE